MTIGLLGIPSISAQTIQDSAICYGYGTDLQPNGVGNTIFQYTEKVGLWVKIQNPPDVVYRIVWEDPSWSQFKNSPVTVIDKDGADWGIVFDSINIAESTASNKLGEWTAVLYIAGEVEVTREFEIIDYAEIIEGIQGIRDQIEDIVAEKDELLALNNELENALETLQTDYADLESQVGTSSDYETLQDNYDELLDDYEELKASQGSTRTMMYAALVVAIVSVVVAVYFGALKK